MPKILWSTLQNINDAGEIIVNRPFWNQQNHQSTYSYQLLPHSLSLSRLTSVWPVERVSVRITPQQKDIAFLFLDLPL